MRAAARPVGAAVMRSDSALYGDHRWFFRSGCAEMITPYITRFVPSTRPMTPCELSPSVTAADLAWRRPAGRPPWPPVCRVSRRRFHTLPEHRRTAPKVIAAWRGRAVAGGRRRARFAIRSAAVQQRPLAWCRGSAAFLGHIALFTDDIRLAEPRQRCVHDLACATQRSGPGLRCHGDHRTPPDAVRPTGQRLSSASHPSSGPPPVGSFATVAAAKAKTSRPRLPASFPGSFQSRSSNSSRRAPAGRIPAGSPTPPTAAT